MKRHEVHPARLSTSRNNGRWPTAWERFADIWRNSPAFERCLAVGLAAMTAATIAYSVWRSM